mmetsp:Transcript_8797/g.26442  ORF Transcript_8797/g.26442 Transcript_8797/m.26442 type:complete len:209 (+) Transcript_8797:158-784(+)
MLGFVSTVGASKRGARGRFCAPRSKHAVAKMSYSSPSPPREGGQGAVAVSEKAKEYSDFSSLVREYFETFGNREIDKCVEFFTEDVEVTDTLFPEPFKGKEAAIDYLKQSEQGIPDFCKIIIDDMTGGTHKVAARWHMEIKGKPIINSRGVSFWTQAADGLIGTEYTIVEPPLKTGEIMLTVGKVIKPLRSWAAKSKDAASQSMTESQ